MARKIILLTLLGLLSGAGLVAAIIPFNKYEWSTGLILDCDTEGEFFFVFLSSLIWLGSALFFIWFIRSRNRVGKNLETILMVMAMLTCLGTGFKTYQLTLYSTQIAKHCAQ